MKEWVRPILLATLILASFSYFTLTTEPFLSPLNLSNLVTHMSELLLIALPMTAIMISGGIDLSVGSTFSLSAVILGLTWSATDSMPLALTASLLVALLAGLINGTSIAYLRIPPLLVTLATMSTYRGIALGLGGAHSMGGYPDWFLSLGTGQWRQIPNQTLLLFPCLLLSWILMEKTALGRQIYLMGSGERLAFYTGIPVARRKLFLYIWSGFMAGLAGILFVARVSTAKANYGAGIELHAITAVVLGGTSISGGHGSLMGTFLGLLLIRILLRGMELNNILTEWQIVAVGALLICSSLGDRLFAWAGHTLRQRRA